MKILSFNCEGPNNNLHVILDIVNKDDPEILMLQETMLRSYNVNKLTKHFRGYKWFIKTKDSTLHPEELINKKNLSQHGTALGLRLDLAESAVEIRNVERNAITVTMTMGGTDLMLMCLYMPTRDQDDEFLESVSTIIEVVEQNKKGAVISMGDLNVSSNSTERRKSAWRMLLKETGLDDHVMGVNTHHHHVTGTCDELDRLLTSGVEVVGIKVIKDTTSSSDHYPVLATVRLEVQNPTVTGEDRSVPAQTKIKLDKLDKAAFAEHTNLLAAELREVLASSSMSMDDVNALISSSIWRTALNLTGQKPTQSSRTKKRKRRKYPVDRHLYAEARRTHSVYQRSSRHRGCGEWKAYKSARQRLRNSIRDAQKKEEDDLQQEIIESHRQKSHQIYRVLKKVRHGRETPPMMPTLLVGYGRVYHYPNVMRGFRELYQIQGEMDYQDRFDESALDLARELIELRKSIKWTPEEDVRVELTREVFDKTVRGLASGKAQDSQGLSNDLVKLCGEDMKQLIFEHLRDVMKTDDYGGLKRNFGKGAIIVKKEDKSKTVIGNYRKIVSNNVLSNIVQYILQGQIEEKMQKIQTEFQLGFTKDIPVMHAVIARDEVLSLSRHMKRTCYMAILDLKSCFPRIPREHLLQLLAPLCTPQEWNLVEQIYRETWSDVRMQGKKSEPFRQNIGTIEGGVLSVQLLKLFLSVLLKMLQDAGFDGSVNWVTGELRAGMIGIADDVVLYAWDPDTLRTMLYICEVWTNRFRATFSPEKSVILIQSAKGDYDVPNAFTFYDQPLAIVNEAEHLGTPAVGGSNADQIMRDRVKGFRKAIHGAISFFGPKSVITQSMKLDLWQRIFKPVLMFATETTNLKSRHTRELNKCQAYLHRAAFRLSKNSSRARMRMFVGEPQLEHEVIKQRLSTLNGIMTRRTLPRRYVLMNLLVGNKESWSYQTMLKLVSWFPDNDPTAVITLDKKSFKTGIKAAMMRIDRVELTKAVETVSPFKVPVDVYQTRNPLLNCSFSWRVQTNLDKWMKAMTGDFYRARGPGETCLVCHRGEDTVEHFLNPDCEVESDPASAETWARIVLLLRTCFPHLRLASQTDPGLRSLFIINPCCLRLGKERLPPCEVQGSGLDNLIREWVAKRISYRYTLLRRAGVIGQKETTRPRSL